MVHSLWSRKIKFFIKVALFLLFITNYQLPITNYQCYAQDRIVAVVNDEIITQKDLNDFISFTRMQLSQQTKDQKQIEDKIQEIKSDLLNKLIEDRLVLQQAKKENIRVDENRVKARVDELKARYGSGARLEETIQSQGLTLADLENRFREQLMSYSIIEYKVKSKINVNPSEVTAFYQGHLAEFSIGEEREFELINTKDEFALRQASVDLKEGLSFEEVAKKYNLTVSSITAAVGGQLNKEIEAAVFKLKLQEISAPIKFQDTYYIFRLVSVLAPKQATLAEVQDEIYAYLYNKKIQDKMTSWLDEIRKKVYIKVF